MLRRVALSLAVLAVAGAGFLPSSSAPSSAVPVAAHVQTGELAGVQIQPRVIAGYAYEAGWRDPYDLVTAVAICLAESQGFSLATNSNPDGSIDRGIWQLNNIHKAYTDAIAFDPYTSTLKAYELYKANGYSFRPWAAYNSGVYLRDSYIGRAAQGVGNLVGDMLLRRPVPPKLDGTPYVHTFTTPMLNFQHRLLGGLVANQEAARRLGFGNKSKATVLQVQYALARGRLAAKEPRPIG